jgi:hypothetical protein
MLTQPKMFFLAAAAFLTVLAAAPGVALDTYWVHDPGTPAAWEDPLNWDNGVPASVDNAYIDNDGAALIYNGAAASQLRLGRNASGTVIQEGGTTTLYSLDLGSLTGSTGIYYLNAGELAGTSGALESEMVGSSGNGEFNQAGGANTVRNLSLGYSAGSSGTYNLSGGDLSAAVDTGSLECVGYNGVGEFNQTGGTHTVGSNLTLGYMTGSSGAYNLQDGTLTAVNEFVGRSGTGAFHQTGGTNNPGYFNVVTGSSYVLEGGTLNIEGSALIQGTFDCANGDAALNVNGGLADFSNTTITNSGSTSFSSAANTLTIFASGFDPSTAFGSYNPAGMVHVAGNTLVVHAGEGFTGRGTINDPIECEGAITAATPPTWPTTSLQLNNDVRLFNGGSLNFASQSLNVASGKTYTIEASGGSILASYISLQNGSTFIQKSGTNLVYSLSLNSSYTYPPNPTPEPRYDLSGGDLMAVGAESIDGSGISSFNQSGGTNTTKSLYIGFQSPFDPPVGPPYASDAYNITGGTLTSGRIVITVKGYFNDSGALYTPRICVWDTFLNRTDQWELFHLTSTDMVLWDGVLTTPVVLNMKSLDKGASWDGYTNNFALGNLIFSGSADRTFEYRLDSDVYTYGLSLQEGAHLDLNGYTLYYVPMGVTTYTGLGASTFCLNGTWSNGRIIPIQTSIPEPGAFAFIAPALIGIAMMAVRKVRKGCALSVARSAK